MLNQRHCDRLEMYVVHIALVKPQSDPCPKIEEKKRSILKLFEIIIINIAINMWTIRL